MPKLPCKASEHSLVDIALPTINVPFRWIDPRILDHGRIKLVQIYAKLFRFVVIQHRKVADNDIAARTFHAFITVSSRIPARD